VVARHAGVVPATVGGLREVPGIGAYTAGAIASIAYGARAALVDGNVARVLARVLAIDDDVKSTAGARRIWSAAEQVMAALPAGAAAGDLNQGVMELGATVCTANAPPACLVCPVREPCRARATGRQAELPVMPVRRRDDELPLLARTALWIADGDRVVLARRVPAGLFGGLWELPAGDDVAAAAAAIGATVVATGAVVMTHRQVLSHRRLVVDVVPARLAATAPAPAVARGGESSYDAVSWHPVHAAPALGLAAATAAILAADKDSTWTSTPTPWPCSSRATRRSSKGSARSATRSTTRTSSTRPSARPKASTSSSTTRSRSSRRSRRC
jgi:adenine-specific DNA glycosylase